MNRMEADLFGDGSNGERLAKAGAHDPLDLVDPPRRSVTSPLKRLAEDLVEKSLDDQRHLCAVTQLAARLAHQTRDRAWIANATHIDIRDEVLGNLDVEAARALLR